MVGILTPGPGAYSPDKVLKSSPSFSMGLKNAKPDRNATLSRTGSAAAVGTYRPEASFMALATRAPAYTMGRCSPRTSHSYIQPTSSPGPQHYGESRSTKDSLLKSSPSFSFGLKEASSELSKSRFQARSTTDPGAYAPVRSSASRASPRYSMGARTPTAPGRFPMSDAKCSVATKGMDSPGPGAYRPSTTITSKAKTQPCYTMKARVPAITKTPETTPGPGSYSTSSSTPTIAEATQAWLRSARPSTGAKMGRVEHIC